MDNAHQKNNRMFLSAKSLHRLTFTRFIAVLIVVAFHFGANAFPFNNELISSIFRHGPQAVLYFFFLSGFIMSSVYATASSSDFNTKKYWIARIARIYPLYFLGLCFSYYITTPTNTELALNTLLVQSWFSNYALTMNNPGWSLSVEAFFYAAFPFFVRFLTRDRVKSALAVSIILYATHEFFVLYLIHNASMGYSKPEIMSTLTPYFPLRNLPIFLLGASIGATIKHYGIPRWLYNSLKNPALPTILLLLWIHFHLQFSAIAFALLITSLTFCSSNLVSALSGRAGVFLGEASYAIYIIHYPLYLWFLSRIASKIDGTETLKFYFFTLIAIAVAIPLYVLVENPARKAINNLYRPRKGLIAN